MKVEWLGQGMEYKAVLALQEACLEEVRLKPDGESVLLLLEHAPVYTMGRMRDQSSLGEPALLPYPVVEINRGGQATYHGPGQIVGYPIVNLEKWNRDLHAYVHGLEECLVRTCREYGVEARRRDGLVGVWVEDRKLASIGVGVRHWVAMHGFALNVTRESLKGFPFITPCGLSGVTMTCLEEEMEKKRDDSVSVPSAEEFGYAFARHFMSFISVDKSSRKVN